jgi:myo-inositol-1-phosphate synthase
MSKKVRVAIAGVGNCASALVQGTSYYHRYHSSDDRKKGNENDNNNNNNNNNNTSTRSNISSSNDSTSTSGSYLAPPGLIAYNLGGIEPSDIEFVAAFDVVESKVGRDLADAIFASPNNTIKISDVNKTGITVEKGEVLDGVGNI